MLNIVRVAIMCLTNDIFLVQW